MAVYKVPQDVEAEDKFLGPLSFKQFIFFGGASVSAYLVFIFMSKGLWYIALIFALPLIGFGFLAFPWSKDQPTELWLAARIRFMFMKRKRIWDQSGMKDLVTITAPKREIHALTDGLTQDEVRTRFNALASVIDSRGWAVKNFAGNSVSADESDRLAPAVFTQPTNDEEVLSTATDVMDEKTNPLAQQFDSMIEDSKSKHHKETLDMIQEARQSSTSVPLPMVATAPSKKVDKSAEQDDLWFLKENAQTPIDPSLATFKTHSVVKPGQAKANQPTIGMGMPVTGIKQEDEQKLLEKVHLRQKQDEEIKHNSHLKTIQPLSAQGQPTDPIVDDTSAQTTGDDDSAQASSATPVDPAILDLASNDDLNVETLARQAKKDMPDEGEVIISLH